MKHFSPKLILAYLMVIPVFLNFAQAMSHSSVYNPDAKARPQQIVSESVKSTVIVIEDFTDNVMPPADWSIEVGPGTLKMHTGTHAGGTAPQGHIFGWPQSVGTTRLISPVFDVSSYSELQLEFKHAVGGGAYGNFSLRIETTSDGGTTWNEVWSSTPSASYTSGFETLAITTADLGSENFQFCLAYEATDVQAVYFAYFDDFELTGTEVVSNYTVTFNVKDADATAIEGAEIALADNGTMTTDALGQAAFADVALGTFTYDITATDFIAESGSVTVTNANVEETVVLSAIPDGNLSLSYEDETFESGETVTIQGEASLAALVSRMGIQNNYLVAKNILVSKEIISETSGHTNTFCWGVCYPASVFVSELPVNLEAGALNDADFSGDLIPNGFAGTTTIKYTFFEENNTDVEVHFFVEYVVSPVLLDPPTNFTAEVVGGDDVEMSWVAPNGLGYIQWDAGINTGNGIGMTGASGGTFLAASRWTAADLAPYDGNYMTSIKLFPNGDAAATFVLKAWTGANAETEILSQVVASTNVDEFNEIVLDSPIMIDASQELWFGYECTHGAGTFPGGCDDGPAIQEMGDQISVDGGASWTGMSAAYGLDYNWNLAGYLSSSDNGKEIAKPMVKQTITPSIGRPVASGSNGTMAKRDNNSTKGFVGFNVYRDGEIIALEIGESTYTDMNLLTGSYTFEVKAVYDEGLSANAEPGPITLNIGDLVDRDHVMVEMGTGTWCGFCPGAAMGADDMHEQGLSVGIIEYHSGDEYETTESVERLAYYGISGYPTAYFDGIISHEGGNTTNSMYDKYLPKYEQRINTPAVFEIESYYYNTTGNDYEVYISVEMIDTYSNLDNLKVFAVLTESHIPKAWSGLEELNFVCRDMIPDATGTGVDFSGTTTESYTLGFSIPAAYVMTNLEMVVFIQDIASKEVLQGTIAPYTPVGVEEIMDNTITMYPNPTRDYVTIEGNIMGVTVFNYVGQIIYNQNIKNTNIRINTQSFETGLYIVQIRTENGFETKKLIIE